MKEGRCGALTTDNIKKAINIATELNSQKLFIPLLDGFKMKSKFPNGFLATDRENFTERFATSNVKYDFDNSIINDIKSTIEYGKKHNAIIDINNIKYCGTYNYSFKFKLYLKDIVVNNSFIREIDAYFINEHNNTFNIISLSTRPLKIENAIFLKDINANENNKIINYLIKSMNLIIKNVK